MAIVLVIWFPLQGRLRGPPNTERLSRGIALRRPRVARQWQLMQIATWICLLSAAAPIAPAASTLEALKPLAIWPKGAPGETAALEEKDTTDEKSQLIAGRRVIRLTGVSTPTITVYPAPKEKNTGAAVLVFPGGGYNILAFDLEGTEVCEWLNSIGVTGVLLKYRVPAKRGSPREIAPLQDAQRAIRLVRAHASDWGVNPERVGVLGFSAGAHLAAALSNNFDKRTYDPQDEADKIGCRPDFAALIYPGLLTEKNDGVHLLAELTVSGMTSPTLLVQAEDDPVKVENSLIYYAALKQAKVPAEMHLFAKGGHGYGLRRTELPVTNWPHLAEQWMRTLGATK
jgi:acetyl esterase/lipase